MAPKVTGTKVKATIKKKDHTKQMEPEKASSGQETKLADRGPVLSSNRAKGAKPLGASASKAHSPNVAPQNMDPDGSEVMMKGLRRLTLSKIHQPMDRLMKIMGELNL